MSTIKFNSVQFKIASYGVWLVEKNASKAHKIMSESSIEMVPTKRCLQKYFAQFRRQEFVFEISRRSGRPKTATTEPNIEKIRECIAENRKLTIKKLSAATGIKRFSLWSIITNKLKARKLRPAKNPHKLTQRMEENRLFWCRKSLKFLEKNKNNIVTSDETYLLYEYDDHEKQWTLPNQDYPRVTKVTRFSTKKRIFSSFLIEKDWFTLIINLKIKQRLQVITSGNCIK